MVHATSPQNPTVPTQSSNISSNDDDWDVVDANTAAVLKPDPPSEHALDAESSKDRMSFILVGESVMPGRFRTQEPPAEAVPAVATTIVSTAPATQSPPSPPSPPRSEPAEQRELASSRSPAVSPPPAKSVSPSVSSSQSSPMNITTPAGRGGATTVQEALRRMAEAPSLPGTPPVAPATPPLPPPSSRIFEPPLPRPLELDARQLREAGSLRQTELTARQMIQREVEVDFRRLVNEWRQERQSMGDAEAHASVEADANLARRLAQQERARELEAVTRRREDEEKRTAEMLLQVRQEVTNSRAKGGASPAAAGTARRLCDCLGASSGLHRANCPLRDP
jgi:hypothetical protein